MSDTRRIEYRQLSEIAPAKRNVKKHDVAELIQSIRRFGFNDAVIIDERTGQLVSGHGRVEALREMHAADWENRPVGIGWWETDIGQKKDRWTVPVQLGWSSKDDTEAEAFLVAANRLVERGGYDSVNLAAVLKDLASADALDGIGYDKAQVEALINRPMVIPGITDAAGEWVGMPEFNQGDRTAFQSIVIHFQTQADVDAFAALVKQPITPKTRSLGFPATVEERYADKAYVQE